MSERMHLRARLAMEFYKLTVLANSEDDRSRDACIAWAVPAADALLAELQKGELEKYPTAFAYEAVCKARDKWQGRAEAAEARVAELDTRLHKLNIEYGRVTDGWSAASTNEQRLQARVKEQDGIIEARNKSLGDAEARVRDLTAQIEALNHLDEEAADEAREWKARAERAETRLKDAEAIPASWLGVSEKLREYETRLAAIDAAKAGEPPKPNPFHETGPEEAELVDTEVIRLSAWGRQGWDAAAALRVELAEEQEGSKGAVQAMAHQCVKAREEGRKEERERIVALLTGNTLILYCRDSKSGQASGKRLFRDEILAALEPPTKEEK